MPKKKTEFKATIFRSDDYLGNGDLEFPFTWSEYQDALEKARAADGKTPVTIELTYAKRNSLRPYTMDINDGTLSDTRNLLELNMLARRLDGMDEDALNGFEAMIILEERKSDQPIPVARLINMTYETDNCVYAANICTHADLGLLLFESDMMSDTDYEQIAALKEKNGGEIPKEWLALIGRQHLEAKNGIITEKGYFECPNHIPEVFKRGEMGYFDRSSAPVVLEISSGAFGKRDYAENKVVMVDCPANPIKLADALKTIGADSIEECMWRCTDCLIPTAKNWIAYAEEFEDVERFADFLHNLERRETPEKYKALLQAAECADLDTALRLGADLDAYEFQSDQETPAHYGKAALYDICGDEAGDALFPYMDCFKYGKDLMASENAAITDYGIIRRLDAEPIQVSDDNETEDFGMGGMT
jgi:hypothetical protein